MRVISSGMMLICFNMCAFLFSAPIDKPVGILTGLSILFTGYIADCCIFYAIVIGGYSLAYFSGSKVAMFLIRIVR